jgi:hypothetical protein
MEYDVFLCYNNKDSEAVADIERRLVDAGLKPWFDKHMLPGRAWISEVERQVGSVHVAAIFIGPYGLGKVQEKEYEAVMSKFFRSGHPIVVPVILPGGKEVSLPEFLRGRKFVDYGLDPQRAFEDLVASITEPSAICRGVTTKRVPGIGRLLEFIAVLVGIMVFAAGLGSAYRSGASLWLEPTMKGRATFGDEPLIELGLLALAGPDLQVFSGIRSDGVLSGFTGEILNSLLVLLALLAAAKPLSEIQRGLGVSQSRSFLSDFSALHRLYVHLGKRSARSFSRLRLYYYVIMSSQWGRLKRSIVRIVILGPRIFRREVELLKRRGASLGAWVLLDNCRLAILGVVFIYGSLLAVAIAIRRGFFDNMSRLLGRSMFAGRTCDSGGAGELDIYLCKSKSLAAAVELQGHFSELRVAVLIILSFVTLMFVLAHRNGLSCMAVATPYLATTFLLVGELGRSEGAFFLSLPVVEVSCSAGYLAEKETSIFVMIYETPHRKIVACRDSGRAEGQFVLQELSGAACNLIVVSRESLAALELDEWKFNLACSSTYESQHEGQPVSP